MKNTFNDETQQRPKILTDEEYEQLKKENMKEEKRRYKRKYRFCERTFLQVTPIFYILCFINSLFNLFNCELLSLTWIVNIIILIISILCFGGYCEYFNKNNL